MKKCLLFLIRFYQKYLSFDTGLGKFVFPSWGACRFSPTCSQYAYEAISKYGILRGTILSFKRIVKCHPGNKGGWDNIP